MRSKLQFGAALLALASCAALPGFGWAQNPHPDRPPQHQPKPQVSHPHPQHPNANRPPVNANPSGTNTYHPPANPNHTGDRPPEVRGAPHTNFNNEGGPRNGGEANLTRRQQAGIGAPRPWVDQMRDLSPGQRERVLQNSKAFQNLSPEKQNKIRQQFSQWDHLTPQQQSSLRENENTWRKLTPEQQQHIKNDVLPKWREMPWDRQQAMKQKLGVLQNMPESARNQRLNDPNFTKGMTEDEKSMLHDLSHTHVGGAPEPPSE
jgi:hypothetical protein